MTDLTDIVARAIMEARCDGEAVGVIDCQAERQATAALASLREAGYVVVPKEPSEEMKVAGLKEGDILGELVDWRGPDSATREDIDSVYRAMIAAAEECK